MTSKPGFLKRLLAGDAPLLQLFFAFVLLERIGLHDGCDLDPWVHLEATPGEEGYHVLCTSAGGVSVYPGGVRTDTPTYLEFVPAGKIRKRLTAALKISRTLQYETHKGRLEWQKQPWLLFTEDGEEVEVGSEDAALSGRIGVFLLFEGGAWRWPTIRIGYEREVLPGAVLRTVARQPALFELHLQSHSGEEQCSAGSSGCSSDPTAAQEARPLHAGLLAYVIDKAKDQLGPSLLEGRYDATQRSSQQVFLPYGGDANLQQLSQATGKLLRAPQEQLEALQVLRYTKGQHYDAHRDYWDPREFPDKPRFTNGEGYWSQRFATLLWYLQAPDEGGETWFPRAHGGPIPYGEWTACDGRGAKMSGKNATAVLFYNLRADGHIDEYSWHCGCPVKEGVKWAANSWMKNTGHSRRRATMKKEHVKKQSRRIKESSEETLTR